MLMILIFKKEINTPKISIRNIMLNKKHQLSLKLRIKVTNRQNFILKPPPSCFLVTFLRNFITTISIAIIYGTVNEIWQKSFERFDFHVTRYAFVLLIWRIFRMIFVKSHWQSRRSFSLFTMLISVNFWSLTTKFALSHSLCMKLIISNTVFLSNGA